jgi:hypothetical protein
VAYTCEQGFVESEDATNRAVASKGLTLPYLATAFAGRDFLFQAGAYANSEHAKAVVVHHTIGNSSFGNMDLCKALYSHSPSIPCTILGCMIAQACTVAKDDHTPFPLSFPYCVQFLSIDGSDWAGLKGVIGR